MWAIARLDLGISRKEFRRITPRQFTALRARWQDREKQREEHRYWRAGMICATVGNSSFGKDPSQPALQPSNFFPLLAALESGEVMDDDQILGMCQLIAAERGKAAASN